MPLKACMVDKVVERLLETQGSRKACYYDDTGNAHVTERIGIERGVCCVMIEEIFLHGGLVEEMNMEDM